MNQLVNKVAEERLLGACLENDEILNKVIDKIAPGDFADVRYGTIFSAICRVAMQGNVSPTSVIEELRRSDDLNVIGGENTVKYVISHKAKMDEVLDAVKVIRDLSSKRDQVSTLRTGISVINEGGDPINEIAKLNEIVSVDDDEGWYDIGSIVDSIIDGTHNHLNPTILETSSGNCLIYPKRLNIIMGAPESMKSWTAKYACIQMIKQGKPVIYIDCEESDGTTFGERIYAIARGEGVSDDVIKDWTKGPLKEDGTRDASKVLLYYTPAPQGLSSKLRGRVLRAIKNKNVSFIVLDGFASAMASSNLEEDKAKDVNLYLNGNLFPFISAGAGVLVVDHISKSAGNQNSTSFQSRGPRGSGAKLAAVSGVALQSSVVIAGSSTSPGRVEIFVNKDRPGRVKIVYRNGKRLCGVLTSTPSITEGKEIAQLKLLSVDDVTQEQAEKRWDLIAAERISTVLVNSGRSMTKSEIYNEINDSKKRAAGKGIRQQSLTKGMEFLFDYGWVAIEKKDRSEIVSSVSQYKSQYGEVRQEEVPF